MSGYIYERIYNQYIHITPPSLCARVRIWTIKKNVPVHICTYLKVSIWTHIISTYTWYLPRGVHLSNTKNIPVHIWIYLKVEWTIFEPTLGRERSFLCQEDRAKVPRDSRILLRCRLLCLFVYMYEYMYAWMHVFLHVLERKSDISCVKRVVTRL